MATGSIKPFVPSSTATLIGTTNSSNVALGSGGDTVVVTNTAASIAFVRFGSDSTIAASTTDMPVLPGSRVILALNPLISYAAAVLTSGTGNILFTRGDGSIV